MGSSPVHAALLMNRKKIFYLFLALTLFFVPGTVRAFIPQTPHLLYMMIQKVQKPAGLVVCQTRTVFKLKRHSGSGTLGSRKAGGLTEKLFYQCPDRMRKETIANGVTGLCVADGREFIAVQDGRISGYEKSALDFYTDILLYREYDILEQQMARQGVDTEKVVFRRLDSRVCYVIGRDQKKDGLYPSLWIDKESLFPVRYVLVKKGWTMEYRYNDWQETGQAWYPMETDIYMDGQRAAQIRVSRVEFKSDFSPGFFDISHIMAQYPETEQSFADTIRELDRRLEDFKKIYE